MGIMKYNKTAEMYNNRFDLYGNDIKTVGWGSREDQSLRFEVLFRDINPYGKKILDIGCGLGDLISFLDKKTDKNFDYIGIDIAEKLIIEAKKKYNSHNRNFYVTDIFSFDGNFDIIICSGALSHKSKGILNYAYRSLERMYNMTNEIVSVNFLSKYVDFESKKNQHYYPEKVYKISKTFCDKINLIDDYPLYEFTLQLKK